jgi:hypothetical protein
LTFMWPCIVNLGKVMIQLDATHMKLLFEEQQLPHSAHNWRSSSTRPQPAIPVLHIICGSSLHCTPDDGHTDARNMLRWINFICVASSWIITLSKVT